jgi:NitT/TauT family transport system substrate-binding protein
VKSCRSFRNSIRTNLLFVSFLVIIFLDSCQNREKPTLLNTNTKNLIIQDTIKQMHIVRLLPYWVPSAQFAGYYVGIEKGIFKKHGINLDILPFDPQMSASDALLNKKTDFALFWLVNAMEMRDKGVDIVNIAQLSSRSSLMLITRKSSGISKIEDMNGKRAGIWIGFERQPQALFKKFNLDVKIIPIGSTNNLFLQGGVDILNANLFDEYHSLLNNGVDEDELNKFFFADYGLNFMEDGIYCLNEKVRDDPQICNAFVEAALESWNYAFNNQEEAVDIVVKYAKAQNQAVNHSHQRWMLSVYKTLYIPEGTSSINTNLVEKDYETIQQIMIDSRLINKITPYHLYYRPYDKLMKN